MLNGVISTLLKLNELYTGKWDLETTYNSN
jgi:hypothetical protein